MSFDTLFSADAAVLQRYLNAGDREIAFASNGKQSLSIDQAANKLVGGEPGWSAALGQPFTVTYAYRASEPAQYPSDASGFQRFNTAQISQAELALKAWSDVANIRFVRVGDGIVGEGAYSNSAAILIGNYTSGVAGSAGFALFPGSTNPLSASGDVWINYNLSYNISPSADNYGGSVIVHELGHSIGLGHPGDYGSQDGPGVTYDHDAEYYEDSIQYTVMSYFDEVNTGGSYGPRYPSAPQLDDIAAAQREYGANMATRTGDTVYGFNATADRPWFMISSNAQKVIFAVWDAGGVDTFDFSGYVASQVIDLRPGYFSDVGGLVGNVAIAAGAWIENARGGSGGDVIHGNSLSNNLGGNGGNDTIDGGSGGSNYLRGDDGNDSIVGGAGFDDINGNMGDDTASGGLGDDWVVGGKDNDSLSGGAGADLVYGNLGNDTLRGDDGDDIVRGGQGDDSLSGGAGADYVSGDRGADTMTGGAGADMFHSFVGAGLDRVLDFNLAEGDTVVLDPGTPWTATQAGADTIISFSPDDQMVLVGVSLASLTGAWIVAPP